MYHKMWNSSGLAVGIDDACVGRVFLPFYFQRYGILDNLLPGIWDTAYIQGYWVIRKINMGIFASL